MSDEVTKIILGDTAISAIEGSSGSKRRKKKEARPPLSHCENCGTLLTGHYCAKCGQPAVDYRRSFRHVIGEMLEEFLSWDSKVFVTLGHLVTRPWKLTNEFLAGHRVRYLNPLRLCLLISLLFFFVCKYAERNAESSHGSPIVIDPNDLQPAEAREPKPDATPPIDKPSEKEDQEKADNPDDVPFIVESNSNREKTTFELWLNQAIIEKIGRHGEKGKFFLRSFMEFLPYMMFFCIPLFAFILKILYIFRRLFYIDHFIYALHIHSFAYLATLIIWGTGLALRHSPGPLFGLTLAAMITTVVIQIFLSIRLVYRQNWFLTLFKFWLGGFIYFFVLLLGLAGTFFATLKWGES